MDTSKKKGKCRSVRQKVQWTERERETRSQSRKMVVRRSEGSREPSGQERERERGKRQTEVSRGKGRRSGIRQMLEACDRNSLKLFFVSLFFTY